MSVFILYVYYFIDYTDTYVSIRVDEFRLIGKVFSRKRCLETNPTDLRCPFAINNNREDIFITKSNKPEKYIFINIFNKLNM
jgi:hypothetical protein